MSMSCANCDAEIPEGASICDNCGMPISEAPPPQEAPPQKAPVQPPRTPPLAQESMPDRQRQFEESERLSLPQATILDSAPAQDQNRTEQRRRIPRWAIRALGLVGTAAAGLMGIAAFWRRGIDALAKNPTANSPPQQDMAEDKAAVQDPASIDQSKATPDPADEVPTTAADTPPPLEVR